MPEISRFFGIVISMFYKDHNPPHFHAFYNEFEAVFSIKTLEITSGKLPKKVLSLVIEWAFENRVALLENWELARLTKDLKPILPLE